jgi:SAM-dependent methyltransferase
MDTEPGYVAGSTGNISLAGSAFPDILAAMNDVLQKWDARYRDREASESCACRVLSENTHLLPASGSALDLASGLAGNGQLLARHGLDTRAWDISPLAVEKINALAGSEGLPLRAECIDIEHDVLPSSRFDVLTVSYFLYRERMRDYLDLLNPGGILFYQTYTRECMVPAGPTNPAFRLARNELLHLASSLEILFYREDGLVGDTSRGMRGEAMLIARRPD